MKLIGLIRPAHQRISSNSIHAGFQKCTRSVHWVPRFKRVFVGLNDRANGWTVAHWNVSNLQVRHRSSKKIDRIKLNKKVMSYYNDFDGDDFFEPVIAHGESVVDRKSVFQGHCAAINRVEHVDIFLSKLKENKKIENAFHNMWAYRIDRTNPESHVAGKSASIMQDCDDDGEQAAGGRLLNLLQILNVVNVMVVVTRWYGGIQLGPARFKHINNAARDSLVKGGFVGNGAADGESGAGTSQQDKAKSGKGGKSKKKSK